jgi:hypothetical protein
MAQLLFEENELKTNLIQTQTKIALAQIRLTKEILYTSLDSSLWHPITSDSLVFNTTDQQLAYVFHPAKATDLLNKKKALDFAIIAFSDSVTLIQDLKGFNYLLTSTSYSDSTISSDLLMLIKDYEERRDWLNHFSWLAQKEKMPILILEDPGKQEITALSIYRSKVYAVYGNSLKALPKGLTFNDLPEMEIPDIRWVRDTTFIQPIPENRLPGSIYNTERLMEYLHMIAQREVKVAGTIANTHISKNDQLILQVDGTLDRPSLVVFVPLNVKDGFNATHFEKMINKQFVFEGKCWLSGEQVMMKVGGLNQIEPLNIK